MEYHCMLRGEGLEAIRTATGADLSDEPTIHLAEPPNEREAIREAAEAFAERAKAKSGSDTTGLADVLATESHITVASICWTGAPDCAEKPSD